MPQLDVANELSLYARFEPRVVVNAVVEVFVAELTAGTSVA
jgi:hypothetical protein